MGWLREALTPNRDQPLGALVDGAIAALEISAIAVAILPIQEKAMIEDLIKRLDHPSPWVVRGGPGAILAWVGSLRGALNRAFELSREGHGLTSIREPDDRTVIPVEQIWELWERLGMVHKQPTRIADRYAFQSLPVQSSRNR